MASSLPTLRIAALGTTTLFSVIVLGLAAHVTNLTVTNFSGYFAFAALSIATAILSLATLPALIIVDSMRKGAFTSMIIVELIWLGILWVLWLSSAATASQAASIFNAQCNYRFSIYSQVLSQTCREFSAIQAFAYLNWLILFGYSIVLLSFSIMAANRGVAIWTQSVKTADFLGSSPPLQNVQQPVMQQPQNTGVSPAQYPPQAGVQAGWAGHPQAPSPAHLTSVQV